MILDWVPAHFPTDAHGLAHFDGTALYEHADPRKGFHPDWNTAIYNFGRTEVANFLYCNALYWVDRFHIDGLRVDAVASMLYLDYSRREGEWLPNADGSKENREAIAFLRRANELVYGGFPGAVTIAEESTAFPGVSRPTDQGGLGFGFKWNMGWMHDTLDYMSRDPIYRRWSHDKMTFGLLYAFSENFVLPISHDEVVHGKGSLVGKMPGDEWQRFANAARLLRLHVGPSGQEAPVHGPGVRPDERMERRRSRCPGGCSTSGRIRACRRWSATSTTSIARRPRSTRATASLRASAGSSSTTTPSRCSPFCGAARRAIRRSRSSATSRPSRATAIVSAFPTQGLWREALNSDAGPYGGSNMGNFGGVTAEARPSHGFPASATLDACRRWRRCFSSSARPPPQRAAS